MKKIEMPEVARTTVPGFKNGNGQVVMEATGFASESFRGQRVYRMRCGVCRHEYGSNGCDIHARRCPKCQGGAPGEKLRERGAGLFDVECESAPG
jgi:hypothetical protein